MEKWEIINSLNRDLKAELGAVEIYSAHAEAIAVLISPIFWQKFTD